MMKNLMYLLIAFVFLGCSIKDVQQSPQSYRLESVSNIIKEAKVDSRVLLVQKVEGDSVAMSRNIFYKEEGALKPYKFSRWSEIPSISMQQLIVENFGKRGLFKATIPSLSLANSDLILESDLGSFEQVFQNSSSYAHVKMRFRLIERKSASVIASTLLEQKVSVVGTDTHDVINAFNKASSSLIDELGDWIKGTL